VRENRMLRAMRRELETKPRTTLLGHDTSRQEKLGKGGSVHERVKPFDGTQLV
jgi:hypothetical protein